MRRVGRDRATSLLGIGAVAAALAWVAGAPQAAWGVAAGTPVGIFNHALTRLAAGRWATGSPGSVGWMMGASALRLVLAGGVLVWAASRGSAFLIGALVGLLVDVLDYTARLPLWLRSSRRR